jgi:hypothetical protein
MVPSFPSHNEHKIVVSVRSEDYDALNRKAAQMHKSPVELAEKLLAAIVSANLFEAVLDDGE